jgi:hypothetical protein
MDKSTLEEKDIE